MKTLVRIGSGRRWHWSRLDMEAGTADTLCGLSGDAKPLVCDGLELPLCRACERERRDVSEPILSVELPIELRNANTGRTKHWGQAHAFRLQVERLIRLAGHVRRPFPCVTWYRVTRILGKRQKRWDVASWQRGNWKEIEDAMVRCGWWRDDSWEWIRDARFAQEIPAVRGAPSIRIEVYKWEGE